ncbi:two-component system sensor histidine kinase DesK [Saccharothrix variisporea]|uniref:Two-component system sensor histidine kinase DesK n=2 Tax=Saccharothrix variisporea TaxID=543527 RepID=A0A495X6Y6_9PSEU|nr:two-component system sensor histidine kinase DesK [Saccharothrix variisporea]
MGVVTAVFACISLIGFLHVLLLPVSAGAIALSFLCIAALMAMQLMWYARDNGRLRTPLGYGVLAAQACLVYLPILLFGQAWVGMPGFLAGSVLLVLRSVAAWTAFSAIVASMGVIQWLFTAEPIDMLYTAISTVTTGLVVYGLSRLTALVAEVQASRAEIARMAVLQERLRFARDLHDLLGYSLSAIALKIELAHRLIEKSPQEAGDQLLEILEISRLALSDARTVASGYRELSLEEECRSAVSVLQAADIHVELDADHIDLPVQVSTVLATVLREGVTNLLRHSKAKNCHITIRQTQDTASLEIVNDDLAERPRGGRAPGSGRGGLQNLSVRAKEIGGAVTVSHSPEEFRLRAEVPLRYDRHAAARRAESDAAGG